VDQQSRSLPDDFILEEEISWLKGMIGKVRFQLEERMEPGTMAGENGCSTLQDSEGGCLLCRHDFTLSTMA
jgi:hypothetical protein